MIALLRGRVAAHRVGEVVVDVNGVGYRVAVPPTAALPSPGAELTLHTSLAVREDALTLYGFPDAPARDLFELLLGVTGVGPRLALAAVGALGAEGLRRAVVAEDVVSLTRVPGVGRKGAQRIVLELREKLQGFDGAGGGLDALPLAPDGARAEVREALAALGYGSTEISRAMDALPPPEVGEEAEELLRGALRRLAVR